MPRMAQRPTPRTRRTLLDTATHCCQRRRRHVYQISQRVNETWRAFKFGVSSQPISPLTQMSKRMAEQIRDLTAANPGSEFAAEILEQIPAGPGARGPALNIEYDLVREFVVESGGYLPGQQKPVP